MTREEATIQSLLAHQEAILEQEPCEDWYDVPSDEMTLEQAKQAVKDLRKFVMDNHILPKLQPCEDAISRQKVLDIIDGNIERMHDGNAYWKLPEWKQKIIDVNQIIKGQIIHMVSPVTPQPKTGHWITKPHIYGVTYCSECDFELKIDNTNYCPNCGSYNGGNRDETN